MNDLFEWLSSALAAHNTMGLLAAFGFGLASVILSPCHLASVPLAVAFVRRDGSHTTLAVSVMLALGVLVSLAAVGAITVMAGRIAGDLWGLGPWIAAAALILAGLYLLGALQIPTSFALRQDRVPRNKRGAALVGLLLGITLGPCTFAFFAPVFAAAFGVAETSSALSTGLVVAFCVGHTLAITAAGLLGLRVGEWLRRGGELTRHLRTAGGAVLVALGVWVIATA